MSSDYVKMPCISIRQPWADLIIRGNRYLGKKDVENRKRNVKYRGIILIHSPQTIDKKAIKWIKEQEDKFSEELCYPTMAKLSNLYLQTGGIIGAVYIAYSFNGGTACYSRWHEPPNYGLVLRDAISLPFFGCKGQLSIPFYVDVPKDYLNYL